MSDWEAVESNKNFWAPEKPGEEIIGKLVGISDGIYGKRYTLEVVRNNVLVELALPSHKFLQNLMASCAIGDEVKVVFKEAQPPKIKGQSPMMVYQVFKKPIVSEEKVN